LEDSLARGISQEADPTGSSCNSFGDQLGSVAKLGLGKLVVTGSDFSDGLTTKLKIHNYINLAEIGLVLDQHHCIQEIIILA